MVAARPQLRTLNRVTPRTLRIFLAGLLVFALTPFASAQNRRPTSSRPPTLRPAATPAPMQAMKPAAQLITRQPPIVVNKSIYDNLTSDSAHVIVNLTKQRAYLLNADQIAIDSPISSGKRVGMTPMGHFSVLEKDKNHKSSVYGNFCDKSGRIVRAGVSLKIDSAPSGTHYEGAPMLWFMRLTGDGVGMHVGILPGYPASHGCIRMPTQGAEMFYAKVKVGTPVVVMRD